MTLIQQPKDKRLEQRLTEAQRDLIARGAEAKGKSLSDFVIESACLAAELAILDKRVTYMSAPDFDAFTALLDEPPKSVAGLDKLFAKKAPWLA